ncbi:MAG: ssuA 4, partial [Ilumatobacteraceae bacterium]|nr:ssuA 4 [Ilumatobacteraceae bacterium]
MSATRRLKRFTALIALPLFALAACGSDDDAAAVTQAPADTTPASAAPATDAAAPATDAPAVSTPAADTTPATDPKTYEPIVIKFADPGNHGPMAYGKKNGSFDAPLAAVNATIEWVPAAAAFSANFDLLKAGTINTHQAAVSPILGALSNGLDFKIFSISDPVPSNSDGIVATPSSGIKTVADLVGKRVAVNAKAHGEWLLLEALKEAGIDPSTDERVPIQPPDAAAAFAAGQNDAWATFGAFFSSAIAGGGVPIYVGKEYTNYDDVGVVGASPAELEKNPEAFKVFNDVYASLVEKSHETPEDFVNVFDSSGPTSYSGDILQSVINDTKTTPIPHTPGPA